ncbi:DNA primase family protein [Nonomuraea sp. KM90]|uniref:DNA primase family protein n=1 Tax=Nonomuraea sp. KM90 TaxID=3457428 RepID=UPI003FCECE9A
MTPSSRPGGFDAKAAAQQMLDLAEIPVPEPARVPVRGPEPVPDYVSSDGLLPESLTDRGNAKLFVHLYGRDFKHIPGLGWYRWAEYRWVLDESDAVLWAAGEMAERLAHFDPRNRHAAADLRRHKKRALSTAGMHAMLLQAKAAPGMALSATVLDADPYVLCTPAGVVDLRTGLLSPPNPEKHLNSRSATLAPVASPIPRWERFLADTFGQDAEGRQTVDFLHLLLGYSISGDVGAQVLPFLFGAGKNGKSVLLEVMLQLLGDYADAAPPGFLMAKSFDGHPTDLAELHGRRIIVCSELKPGDRFDEARVKLLTGGDKIKARRMRQDFFSFDPTHHLWLLGNHRPEVSTGGFAFWRRLRLIPFERVVAEEHKIDNLARILVDEEGPGILAWLVDGARRYLSGEKDLSGPNRVRLATDAYEATEDVVGRFIADACVLDPSRRAEQTSLYNAYTRWCGAEGATPVSARSFAARIRDTLKMASPRDMVLSNSRKFYPGIGLSSDFDGEDPQR